MAVTSKSAPSKRRTRTAKVAWRKDRISREVDPSTGRHLVDLSDLKVPGMTAAQVKAVYEFEASIEGVGTTKALIRMQKREAGNLDVLVTHRIRKALADLKPSDPIRKFYAES